MTRVTIELEFEGKDLPEDALREAVYSYLEELIEDESLDYTIEEDSVANTKITGANNVDTTYNGWTNYETWKTHLEILDGYEWADAETLKEIVEDILLDGVDNPLAESVIYVFINEVNFEEISEALKEN